MRRARRWLNWMLVPNDAPGKKPKKVPYYPSGAMRSGKLDSPEDVARFGTFEQALAALSTGMYAGLGFALGPDGTGNFWQGIDLDDMPNHPALGPIADDLPGYTEGSPSGHGRHGVGYGRQFASLGSNDSGVEAYSAGRFFTVTGASAGTGAIEDIADFVDQRIRPVHARAQPVQSIDPQQPLQVLTVDLRTVTELRSASFSMRADNRDLWVRMGMALKTLGDVGRGVWFDWSMTSQKFDPADAARVWESLEPTTTDYRAVFAEAQRHGWGNPMAKAAQIAPGGPLAPMTGAAGTNTPPTGRPPGFAFASAGELVTAPAPVEYLVDELIERNSLTQLHGAPSKGKSFLTIDWSCSVATGRPWFERDVRQGSVFYIAGEGHAGFARRLRAWEISTGDSLKNAPLFVSHLPASLMDRSNALAVETEIQRLATLHGAPALIVIDTLARNLGPGDENSNADISVFVASVDGIRLRLGATVIVVHHTGHMEQDRARGASALPAAMDTIFAVEGTGDTRILVAKKSKESELPAPIAFTLRTTPIGWYDHKGREMTSAVIVPDAAGDAQRSRPMPASQVEAMKSFYRTLLTTQSVHRAEGEEGVDLFEWRHEFYKTSTADEENKPKSFLRARKALVERGLLRCEHDRYYIRDDDPGLIAHRLMASAEAKGHGT